MEDFSMGGYLGFCVGFIVGLIIMIILCNTIEEKVKTSGTYLTYNNVIYKQVSEEELDNLVILEVKE